MSFSIIFLVAVETKPTLGRSEAEPFFRACFPTELGLEWPTDTELPGVLFSKREPSWERGIPWSGTDEAAKEEGNRGDSHSPFVETRRLYDLFMLFSSF